MGTATNTSKVVSAEMIKQDESTHLCRTDSSTLTLRTGPHPI